jgi:acyl carrier protein
VSEDEAFEKFKECAVEVLQVPADKVTREARFAEDLDADSLDLVELVMSRSKRPSWRASRPSVRPTT